MKTVITVTGIRPDFIRMSEIFKKLDSNFNHILIHTGQHYDNLLSDVFFHDLKIRKPDYNLAIGGPGKEHFHQTADLSIKLIELIREKQWKPDIILFLGDSNSVVVSVALKKEGYKIGHIEAGMRSGDMRMLEEVNRKVCDMCSDLLFVYHENYEKKLKLENIYRGVHIVGNTIVEVVKNFIPSEPKANEHILLDIHRPENFLYPKRLWKIIEYSNAVVKFFNMPIYILEFPRTMKAISDANMDLGSIKTLPLMPYRSYIQSVYHARFLISDSGTAQEEPALLGTQVIVPRDFTERPESVENYCSFMLDVTNENFSWLQSVSWLERTQGWANAEWLGDGTTSDKIIRILQNVLEP